MRFFALGPRILGIRPGVSMSGSEIARLFKQPARATAMTGSFVYVVEGTHGHSKVGVSTDPLRRLAQLQTGSPHQLRLAYIAATPGDGYDIEAGVICALASSRVSGEWFGVSPEMVVAAIHGVSHQIKQPVQQVQPEWIPTIIQQAMLPGPTQSSPRAWKFWLIGGACFATLFLIMLAIVIALGS